MTKYSWQNLVISFFLIPSLSSFTGIAKTPLKAVNSVNPTNISQSVLIAQIRPQILPNNARPDGYQLQPQALIGRNVSSTTNLSFVKDYVRARAVQLGVNPDVAEFIVRKESQFALRNGYFEYDIRGDDGMSRGIWQISSEYHPEVSDACADDLYCSTDWSFSRIKKGYINEWATWKFRCKWYKDAIQCPILPE